MKKSDTPELQFYELRKVLRDLIYTEINNLPVLLEAMPPEKRIDLVIKMMPFALPKCDTISATSYDGTFNF